MSFEDALKKLDAQGVGGAPPLFVHVCVFSSHVFGAQQDTNATRKLLAKMAQAILDNDAEEKFRWSVTKER